MRAQALVAMPPAARREPSCQRRGPAHDLARYGETTRIVGDRPRGDDPCLVKVSVPDARAWPV